MSAEPNTATPRSPILVSRRRLLHMLGAAGAAGLSTALLGCSRDSEQATATTAAPATGPVVRTKGDAVATRSLVVIEMQGGNDGFAMLVPYGDGTFRRLREHIWIDPKDLHVIDDRYAIAKGLAPIATDIAFVEGVGVANPDLSHSAMAGRWWQGDPEGNRGLLTGFLGRCCDAAAGTEPVTGMSIGGGSTPALRSAKATTVSLPKLDAVRDLMKDEPEQDRFRRSLAGVAAGRGGIGDPGSEAWLELARSGLRAGLKLSTMVGSADEGAAAVARYPAGDDLGSALASVRQMITNGSGVRVFHVPWGDFDTHSNEVGTHTDRMNRLGAALAAFRDDLSDHGLRDRVLVATTSEFGRRPEANGSGTDHGTASTMLLMGPVAPHRYGIPVDFRRLDDDGNVKATTSMADYYATLAGWLGVPADSVLSGVRGTALDVRFNVGLEKTSPASSTLPRRSSRTSLK